MYANSPPSTSRARSLLRTSLLCMVLPCLLGTALAQVQKPAGDAGRMTGTTGPQAAAKGTGVSTVAPPAGLPPEAGIDGEEERARILRKIANDIAYLRQQQALVEAQSALAKAKAELAGIQSGGAQAAGALQVAGAPAVPAEKKASRNDTVQLTGIQGDARRRWASVKVGDGPVQQAETGSVVGGWRVMEVRLNEVLLSPMRGGEPTLLRVEGSVQRAPDSAPRTARKSARTAQSE